MERLFGKSYVHYENTCFVENNDEKDIDKRLNNVWLNKYMADLSFKAPEAKTIQDHIVIANTLVEYENKERKQFFITFLHSIRNWMKHIDDDHESLMNKLITFIYCQLVHCNKKSYKKLMEQHYDQLAFKEGRDYTPIEKIIFKKP